METLKRTGWTELIPGVWARLLPSGMPSIQWTDPPSAAVERVVADWTSRSLTDDPAFVPPQRSFIWQQRRAWLLAQAGNSTPVNCLPVAFRPAIAAIRAAMEEGRRRKEATDALVQAWATEARRARSQEVTRDVA